MRAKRPHSAADPSSSLLDALPSHCRHQKEKTTLPRLAAGVSPLSLRCRLVPNKQYGNIDPFPFRMRAATNAAHCLALAAPLGPTKPWKIALTMKPCSTSVLRLLPGVVATVTKIGTEGGYSLDHSKPLEPPPRLLTRRSLKPTATTRCRRAASASSIFGASEFVR